MPEKLVYCGGVFDLFHVGHLNILQKSKALGDILIVGVLTDAATERYKPRAVIREDQRLQIVRGLSCVDLAVPQSDSDPTKDGQLQGYNPDILVHGSDWDKAPGQEWMLKHDKEVVFLPYTLSISSTEIRRLCCENYSGTTG